MHSYAVKPALRQPALTDHILRLHAPYLQGLLKAVAKIFYRRSHLSVFFCAAWRSFVPITPCLAIAHNAGLPEYTSWEPTIALLLRCRTPFYLTSYAELGVRAATAYLWEVHGVSEQL